MVYRSKEHIRMQHAVDELMLAVAGQDKFAELRALENLVKISTGLELSSLPSNLWHMLQIEFARARLKANGKNPSIENIATVLGVSVTCLNNRRARGRARK